VRPRALADIEPRSSSAPAASAAPPVAVCSATRLSGLDTRLYKYQREIADAISDPEIERITMAKAARIVPRSSRESVPLTTY
jgi:hypothetical protein